MTLYHSGNSWSITQAFPLHCMPQVHHGKREMNGSTAVQLRSETRHINIIKKDLFGAFLLLICSEHCLKMADYLYSSSDEL